MPSPQELQDKFWKALDSDRTLFLSLDGVDDGHAQPMTALRDTETPGGPVWFFTTKDNGLVQAMREGHRAMAHFASKGHDCARRSRSPRHRLMTAAVSAARLSRGAAMTMTR